MTPNWLELPRDVTVNILQRVDTFEIVTSVCQVCTLWWKICNDPLMWRTIHMRNRWTSPHDLVNICRHAVQRSCGHLEEINIEYFCTYDLLNYIADSTSQLRRLGLVKCWGISDEGLGVVAKKLPVLEELEMSSFFFLSKDSVEAIGRCCPLLKVFKFNWPLSDLGVKCDDVALAIAKTMPQLRHLQLKRNPLGEDGLLAILDGCPLLQSLDLQGCSIINVSGSLMKRCEEQIKDLQLPYDWQDDCSDGNDYYGCLYGSDDFYCDRLSDSDDV
ncbi:Leucine-rich repeat [Sesbania bispinosa]|nr:Leucine-rich repeat [Sesbania bispinosa]